MKWFIIARYVAESYIGAVTVNNKPKLFNSEDEARKFGKEVIEKNKYVAMWQAIPANSENKHYLTT